MVKSPKTVFVCQACGCQVPRWMGKCPECGQWDSLVEERLSRSGGGRGAAAVRNDPVPIDRVRRDQEDRFTTGDHDCFVGRVSGAEILAGEPALPMRGSDYAPPA